MTNEPAPRPAEILLVEDSPSDRMLAAAAFKRAPFANHLHLAATGLEALEFLRRQGRHASAPRPDLVLLDLNLPRMDGREVLARLKADPGLRTIPVVVLTTSSAPDDVVSAYGAHANSYITKPIDFDRFGDVLATLSRYWFETVTLPPAQTERAQSTSGEARGGDGARRRGLAILLVEDSPTDALLARHALSAGLEDAEVVCVTRLDEASQRLATAKYDAIVTDLSLPDAGGLDALRELRSLGTGEPIIVLTGSTDKVTGELAMENGAEDFILKSEISAPVLSRAVRYAVHRREARDERHQRQRVEAVGRLAASVAHDFNNVLTAISASVGLLEDEVTGGEGLELLREMGSAATHGQVLVRQLLAFSRRDRFDPKPTDVGELLASVARILGRLLGSGIELQVVASEEVTTARVDAHLIQQALLNLAVNARDVMASGGRLTLRTRSVEVVQGTTATINPAMRPGAYVVIEVEDDGPGIPAEVLPEIFEPFFTTKRASGGTGLGLATVREIMLQHGGAVTVTSEPGKGARFELFLPRAAPSDVSHSNPSPAVPSESATASTAVVLVAEDEPSVRSALCRLLRRRGYRVLESESGQQAWDVWREHRDSIDLVLSDLIMPGALSAIAFVERVRADRPEVPVILSSGYSVSFEDPSIQLVEGVNFLPKPFERSQLDDIVARALAKKTSEA